MASGFSETKIYQMVLDRLVEQTVLSTSDDVAAARWLSRNYPLQRDVLLQKHPWNFAQARAAIAADTAAPAFEWRYQYTLPPDCLRVHPITVDGYRNSGHVDFVVEGGKVLTNKSAPLYVRYTKRVADVGLFSPMFINLLVHILATAYAYTATGKASVVKGLSDSIPGMSSEAQIVDALEGAPGEPNDSDILEVR